MISAENMARIYWRHLKGAARYEVEDRILHLSKTSVAKPYWTEVLSYLDTKKSGRKEH